MVKKQENKQAKVVFSGGKPGNKGIPQWCFPSPTYSKSKCKFLQRERVSTERYLSGSFLLLTKYVCKVGAFRAQPGG